MLISLVVAATENNVIGKNNKLLWHLPNDLRFFKNTTWAMPVIMGRKTFDSLGKPLTGRTNIVITRQVWQAHGVKVTSNLDEALTEASHADAKEAFVIGGGEIFKQSMPLANKIYITRIHTTLEGDTFFPQINSTEWKLMSNLNFKADHKHAYDYSFQIWERQS